MINQHQLVDVLCSLTEDDFKQVDEVIKQLHNMFDDKSLSETIKNNIEQNNDYFYQKYSLGGAYYTDKFHQIMIRFAQESDKEYGFKTEKEMLLRYRLWF